MEAAGQLPDGLTFSAQDTCARRVAIPWALSGLLPAIVVTWFAAREFPATLRDFGVRKPEIDARWFIRFSALLAAVYGIGGLLLLKLAHGIVVMYLVPWREISSYGLWPVTLFLCVSAPLGEEVVFRGILYPALRDKLGVWKAIVVSAAVFAAMHNFLAMRLFMPVTQFVGGLIFAYSYEKSRSLLLPVLYHACGNALLLVGYVLT
jgi:membrane protease YdiL (CAAX protease family)